MFKKLVLALLVIIVLAGAYLGWRYFTAATAFTEKSKYLYIRSDKASYSDLLQTIKDSNFVESPGSFDFLAKRRGLDERVKPGRYEIKKGMSLMDIVRMLRNGTQSPINFTIAKVRTPEGLAEMIGRKFECDSASVMEFINSPDSMKKFDLKPDEALAMVIPDTYTYFWNSTPGVVLDKFHKAYEKLWNEQRRNQAKALGLTPVTATILASIVEEETNVKDEKGLMASVYLNRYNAGMPLGADPTIKYALRNFGLKQILYGHLEVESPYNTYRHKGFPPGPICTPSLETLDAVLQSEHTNYMYFVAKSDFSGRHEFSETFDEHLAKANSFRKELKKQQDIRDGKRPRR
jgi:UPF0755 protein